MKVTVEAAAGAIAEGEERNMMEARLPKARRKPYRPTLPEGWDTGPDTRAQWFRARLRPVRGTRGGKALKVREHEIDRLQSAGLLDAELHRKAEAMVNAHSARFLSASSQLRVDRTPRADDATCLQVDRCFHYARLVRDVPTRALYAVRCVIERGEPLWTLIPGYSARNEAHAARLRQHLDRLREALDAVNV